MSKVKISEELKVLLKQKDLEGRNYLWFIAEQNVYQVMESDLMDKIIQDFWKSNLDITGNLMEASTSYSILRTAGY